MSDKSYRDVVGALKVGEKLDRELVHAIAEVLDDLERAEAEIKELEERIDENASDDRRAFEALSDAVLDAMDAWGPRATVLQNPVLKTLYDLTDGY